MRGNIRRRGPNSYQIRVEMPRDPETKARRWNTETIRGTRKQAEERLNALLVEAEAARGYVTSDRLTVGQYLDRWLAGVQDSIRPTTLEFYSYCAEKWKPAMGTIPLLKLRPLDIQAALPVLQATGSTKRDALRTLRTALNQAVKWGMLPNNPAVGVRLPQSHRKELTVWDEAQVQTFLFTAHGFTRHYSLFHFALSTGLRIGEILALRWQDVRDGNVSVTKTLVWLGKGRGFRIHETKTRSSRRRVPLDQGTQTVLKEHRKRQLEDRLRAGPSWGDNDLVFCSMAGGFLFDVNIRKALKAVTAKAGLPPLRFHGLRHTHATLLLRQGIHPKVVSERLGHARVGITLDTYSHILPDTQEEAVKAIERAMGGLR